MENNKIKVLMLKNGLTLLGECELSATSQSQVPEFVVIKQPVQVVAVPGRDGGQGITFMPFMQFTVEFKEGIHITMTELLTFGTPLEDMENEYRRIFGSGITIAKTL